MVVTDPNSPIELIDNTKGKSKVLTSPSLDDLNNQAKQSWGAPDSPVSIGSNKTVTPTTFVSGSEKVSNRLFYQKIKYFSLKRVLYFLCFLTLFLFFCYSLHKFCYGSLLN